MTTIHHNGSKWAGQAPDSIDRLIEVLQTETLDPTFEEYGNFAENAGGGLVRFFGNFATVSHAFRIDSDEAAVCAQLTAAIRANQATQAYAEARRAVQADHARRLAAVNQMHRRRR